MGTRKGTAEGIEISVEKEAKEGRIVKTNEDKSNEGAKNKERGTTQLICRDERDSTKGEKGNASSSQAKLGKELDTKAKDEEGIRKPVERNERTRANDKASGKVAGKEM